MATPFPRGMGIRQAGPAPVMAPQGNIYQDLAGASRTGSELVDEYQQEEQVKADRQRMIEDMVNKRRVAQDARESAERFKQADMEFKLAKQEEDTRQFEVGEARDVRAEEGITKAQEKIDTAWTDFKSELINAREKSEDGKMPPAEQIAEMARLHGVNESEEGRKRLASLGIKPPKVEDPFQKERFEYQKTQDDEKQEKVLRNEFIQQNKSFAKVGDAYNRIQQSAIDPSPSGDLALIFNFMKMLDPGSTVREGEFATAAAAGDYGDRIQGNVQRIINGQRLTASQRKDFLDRAGKLNTASKTGYDNSVRTYTTLAEQYGLDPSRVTVDIGRQESTIPQIERTPEIQEADPDNLLEFYKGP